MIDPLFQCLTSALVPSIRERMRDGVDDVPKLRTQRKCYLSIAVFPKPSAGWTGVGNVDRVIWWPQEGLGA